MKLKSRGKLKYKKKFEKREELEKERLRKQTEYTNNIMSYGLW
jgi:hypothetical protein